MLRSPPCPLNAASLTPPALHPLPPDTTSSSDASSSNGSLRLLRRCYIWLGGKAPRVPPGSRNKAKVPVRWTPGARGPLRIGAPMQGAANRAAPGTSSALALRGPAPGGALNTPSPVAAVPAPRAPGGIDRVFREVEARPRPPPPDRRRSGATGGGPAGDWSGRNSPPPGGRDAGTPHRPGVPLLGAPRRC
jgi:hypothetical protein